MSFDLEINNGGLSISVDGKIKTVSDTPKLRQDILKIILTSIGTNRFHPWYGCPLNDIGIGQPQSDLFIFEQIKASIIESLNRLKTLQTGQSSTQQVTLAELIASVGPVDVGRSPADPRQINIMITIFTKRLTKIEEVFTIIA